MDRLVAFLTRTPADTRSDGQLLAAFQSEHDEPAFAELTRRHGPLVWGVCRRWLPNPVDAEDAFQATFLVLVQRAHSLSGSRSLGPWLHQVALWTARNARRKNARWFARAVPLADPVSDPHPDPAHTLDLDEALGLLPERCRAALFLCHLEGLTHREAAERLGCAEGTVSSLVSRGLARLRTRLTDPVSVLALAGVLAPATVTAATTRSAVAVQLASLSTSASPAVLKLTQGVLRMFWMKKAAVALSGLALVAVLTVLMGLAGSDSTKAQDKPGARLPAVPQVAPPAMGALLPLTTPKIVPTIQITIGDEKGSWKVSITEFDDQGKPQWTVLPLHNAAAQPKVFFGAVVPEGDKALERPKTQTVLQNYLTRAFKDPAAPKTLRLIVEDGASLEYIWAAVEGANAAGFQTVIYTGCIPPGCGTKAGATPGQTRHAGAELAIPKLLETLRLHLTFC